MPTSTTRRRLALIAAAGAGVIATAGLGIAPAHAWDFPAEQIGDHAAAEPVGYGGQCKVFAERMVNEVLAKRGIKARITGYGTPGGAYFGAYERAGGTLVDSESGQRGDLIQVITPEKKNKDFPPTRDKHNESILHTAIILKAISPGVYLVRDSNYVGYETIGTHRWNPMSWRERGVEVYVWRFGQAPDPIVIPSAYIAAGAEPEKRTLRA